MQLKKKKKEEAGTAVDILQQGKKIVRKPEDDYTHRRSHAKTEKSVLSAFSFFSHSNSYGPNFYYRFLPENVPPLERVPVTKFVQTLHR